MKLATRRAFLKGVAVAGSGLALAACQPQVVQVEKEVTRVVEKEVMAAPAAKKPVTLTLHAYLGYEADWHKERTEAFKDKFPHITFNVEAFPLGRGGVDYFTKLVALHASKTIGDIAWANISAGSMLRLGSDGVWFPVNDLIEAEDYDMGQFYPIAVDTFSLDGKVMGMPMEANPGPCIMVYNKDIFDQAALAYPNESWDVGDVTDAAIKLTADTNGDGKTDVWGTTHNGDWHSIMGPVHRFGGYIIEHLGTKTKLAEPEGRACVQWEADLILKDKVAPTPDQVEEGTEQMFLTSKIATMQADQGALARIGRISEGKLNYQALLYPMGPTGLRGSKLGGAAIPITTNSKFKEEAWEYAKWICNHENGVHRVIAGNLWTGGRPDVYSDTRVLALPGFKESALAWTLIPPELLVHEIPGNFRGPEVLAATNNNLDAIWTGKLGIDEGLNVLVQAVDKVLAQPK